MLHARATVLLVDRDGSARDSLRAELARRGYEVESVADRGAALRAIRERRFDVALTDGADRVSQSELDQLRAADPDLEIIVARGEHEPPVLGGYMSVRKPYVLDELDFWFERALERSQQRGLLALYEASRELLSNLQSKSVAQNAVELAANVLRAGDVRLLLSRSGTFEPNGMTVHRRGEDLVSDRRLFSLVKALTSAGEAAQDGSTEAGERPALAFPLVCGQRAFGALVVARAQRSDPFTASDVQRGGVFARQVALSLENARLYEELSQRATELLDTREQLVVAEKLSLAGRLANSVAHEVNNPLSSVVMNLETIRHYVTEVDVLGRAAIFAADYLRGTGEAEGQVVAEGLVSAQGGTQRVDAFLRDIRGVLEETTLGVHRISELVAGFSRLTEPEAASARQPLDVREVLLECVDRVQVESRSPVQVVAECKPSFAFASRTDLREAITSLLAHLRAAPGPTSLKMLIASGQRDGKPFVRIERQGLSWGEVERRRIFDPKVEVDPNSGSLRLNLDLALAYQRLLRNQAEVQVLTREGLGFHIDLCGS